MKFTERVLQRINPFHYWNILCEFIPFYVTLTGQIIHFNCKEDRKLILNVQSNHQ